MVVCRFARGGRGSVLRPCITCTVLVRFVLRLTVILSLMGSDGVVVIILRLFWVVSMVLLVCWWVYLLLPVVIWRLWFDLVGWCCVLGDCFLGVLELYFVAAR